MKEIQELNDIEQEMSDDEMLSCAECGRADRDSQASVVLVETKLAWSSRTYLCGNHAEVLAEPSMSWLTGREEGQ